MNYYNLSGVMLILLGISFIALSVEFKEIEKEPDIIDYHFQPTQKEYYINYTRPYLLVFGICLIIFSFCIIIYGYFFTK